MLSLFSVQDCRTIPFSGLVDSQDRKKSLITGDIPFEVKRLYYIKNVPEAMERGGHAHRDLFQLFFAINGEYELELYDGKERKIMLMNDIRKPLLVGPGIWRELRSFSPSAICLVLASETYMEDDYIRELGDFENWRSAFRMNI